MRDKSKQKLTSPKASLEDLKALFASGVPGAFKPSKATQRGFAHKHKPTWKPPKSKLTPAQWHCLSRHGDPHKHSKKG